MASRCVCVGGVEGIKKKTTMRTRKFQIGECFRQIFKSINTGKKERHVVQRVERRIRLKFFLSPHGFNASVDGWWNKQQHESGFKGDEKKATERREEGKCLIEEKVIKSK